MSVVRNLTKHLRLTLAVLGVFALSSCSAPESQPRLPIVTDDVLATALESVCEIQGAPLLASLTPWEWDRVSVFNVYSSPELVDKEVGQHVISQRFSSDEDNLFFVFQKDGKIVMLRSEKDVIPMVVKADHSYDNAAVLAPNSAEKTCPRILTSPDDPE